MLKYNIDPNKLCEEDYSELVNKIITNRVRTNKNVIKYINSIKSKFNATFYITEKVKEEALKYLKFDRNNPNLGNWLADNQTIDKTINKILFSRFSSIADKYINQYPVLPSPSREESILNSDFRRMADAKIFDTCIYNNVGYISTHNLRDYHKLNNAHKDKIGTTLKVLLPNLIDGSFEIRENYALRIIKLLIDS